MEAELISLFITSFIPSNTPLLPIPQPPLQFPSLLRYPIASRFHRPLSSRRTRASQPPGITALLSRNGLSSSIPSIVDFSRKSAHRLQRQPRLCSEILPFISLPLLSPSSRSIQTSDATFLRAPRVTDFLQVVRLLLGLHPRLRGQS